MRRITTTAEFAAGDTGNTLIGRPVLENSVIDIKGRNNIIFFDGRVKLVDSSVSVNGDNSVVYLGGTRYNYYVAITVHSNSVFHMGRDNYTNPISKMFATCSEEKHIFIGDDCLLSFGIWFRNADPHLIYSTKTLKRLNPTKSIYVGDHVWIGQNSIILKGTQIASGSIIGANSAVAGKKISSNTSYAGNPARCVAQNVFWDRGCVHGWTGEDTEKSLVYSDGDRYIYEYADKQGSEFDRLDALLSGASTADEKLAVLKALSTGKNRFAGFSKRRPDKDKTE